MIGYRLIHDIPLSEPRSQCPDCQQIIAWYDLIPVISWLFLKGHCRNCHSAISYLYPLIELLTALSIFTLYKLYALYAPRFFWSYLILFSLLVISIRTDLETMLISQYVTLAAIPFGIFAAYFRFLPATLHESLAGAFLGYAILWSVAFLFKKLTGKDGLGVGDMELMAMIGSFIGPVGVWITLTIGSMLGTVIGLGFIIFKKLNNNTKIPFGPFLAIGAMIYVLLQHQILSIILP